MLENLDSYRVDIVHKLLGYMLPHRPHHTTRNHITPHHTTPHQPQHTTPHHPTPPHTTTQHNTPYCRLPLYVYISHTTFHFLHITIQVFCSNNTPPAHSILPPLYVCVCSPHSFPTHHNAYPHPYTPPLMCPCPIYNVLRIIYGID